MRELFFVNNHTFSRNCRPISQHFLITANEKILCSILHFFAVLGAFLVQIMRQLTPRKKHMNKMEGAENKAEIFSAEAIEKIRADVYMPSAETASRQAIPPEQALPSEPPSHSGKASRCLGTPMRTKKADAGQGLHHSQNAYFRFTNNLRAFNDIQVAVCSQIH